MAKHTLVVSATEQEMMGLLKYPGVKSRIDKFNDIKLKRCNLNGKEFLSCVLGIGLVSASSRLATVLALYPVSDIIFVGLAGGMNIPVKSIVVPKGVYHGGFDLTALGYGKFKLPETPGIITTNLRLNERLFDNGLNIHSNGLIMSSDRFIENIEIVKESIKGTNMENTVAFDMESYACCYLGLKQDIPTTVIRVISA